ncbi:BON domain-containing protein [Burkholderia plantarii]|uniref:BON domain-containing protein n=1 Tax=Burkholderia plantarii TaxID=41899 RepID=UPI0018DD56AA|nr:BON domain-containing protein [Burkholderia plantarii]MBI0325605.1 BON domain-containing protein [Burkholderia plantarii]
MQRRHPNRSRDTRGPASWQERNERAYWGNDENDLPHYDDVLLPDDEREIDLHDAREQRPADRIDERRWRDERGWAQAGARARSPEARDGRDVERDSVRAVSRDSGYARRHDNDRDGQDALRARDEARVYDESRRYGGPQRAAPAPTRGGEPYDARGARGRTEPHYPEERSRGGHGAPSHARYDPPGHPARDVARAAHTGGTAPRLRGPKGYTRSDERIREDVCERLAYAIDIDVSDVSVTVTDACVRLDGTVPERWMKHEIEDLADSCVWVRDVDNRVRVARVASGDESYPVTREAQPTLPSSSPSPAASPAPAAHPSGAIGPAGAAEPSTGPAGPDANPQRH